MTRPKVVIEISDDESEDLEREQAGEQHIVKIEEEDALQQQTLDLGTNTLSDKDKDNATQKDSELEPDQPSVTTRMILLCKEMRKLQEPARNRIGPVKTATLTKTMVITKPSLTTTNLATRMLHLTTTIASCWKPARTAQVHRDSEPQLIARPSLTRNLRMRNANSATGTAS
jgi:hypothetical protein